MRLFLVLILSSFLGSIATANPEAKETAKPKIDKEGIRKVFVDNQKTIRGCYDRELAKDPDLKGTVKFDFDVAKGGVVQNAKIKESSTLKNRAVQRCLLAKLKGWKFPEPPADQQVVNVIYPLAFAGK